MILFRPLPPPHRFLARGFILFPSIDKAGEFFYILKISDHRQNSQGNDVKRYHGTEKQLL